MNDIDAMSAILDNTVEEMTTVDNTQATETTATSTENADNYHIEMTKQDFIKFSSVLAIIQNICNDCVIHEGKIRCRTNDHKNMIEMDLTSLIGERNIMFSGLKNKLALLGTFNLCTDTENDHGITIESNDSNFEFSDSLSKLASRKPIETYMENLYITDDEFSRINNAFNRGDAVLFDAVINNMEKKRIARLCEIFNSNTVTFNFLGNTASYVTQTSSKDNVSESSKEIPLTRNLSDRKTQPNNLCFILDTCSDLKIRCYQIDETCIFKCDLMFDNTIPITIYTKTAILDANDDE